MSSIKNLILMNMNLERNNDMAIFYSMNKEYCIVMKRDDVKLWNEMNSFKYFCKFVFKNNLGIPIFELITNEMDIVRFIDTIFSVYVDFNAPEVIYHFNVSSSILETFTFHFIRDPKTYNTTLLISQYNNITGQKIDRVKLTLTDEMITDLLDEMYFIFLIDIDNAFDQYNNFNNYLSPYE